MQPCCKEFVLLCNPCTVVCLLHRLLANGVGSATPLMYSSTQLAMLFFTKAMSHMFCIGTYESLAG